MNLNIFKQSKLTPEQEEKELNEKAAELKGKADHLEKMTILRKEIANSEKRIKTYSPRGFSFSGNKLLFGVVALIIIVLVIVKACGG